MDYVVMVEDIEQVAIDMEGFIRDNFRQLDVTHIDTESAFVQGFERFAAHAPILILLDLTLPWSDGEQEGDPFEAGKRCLGYLADDPRTRDIPVIAMSTVTTGEARINIGAFLGTAFYVQKKSAQELLALMRVLLPREKHIYY